MKQSHFFVLFQTILVRQWSGVEVPILLLPHQAIFESAYDFTLETLQLHNTLQIIGCWCILFESMEGQIVYTNILQSFVGFRPKNDGNQYSIIQQLKSMVLNCDDVASSDEGTLIQFKYLSKINI